MGETVKDIALQVKFLLEHGRAEEPAKLLLPRIASKRRAQNKEKRTKVQWDCTPDQYAAFWTQLKRIREHVGNITIAHDVVNEWLSLLKEPMIDQMLDEDRPETLGDA